MTGRPLRLAAASLAVAVMALAASARAPAQEPSGPAGDRPVTDINMVIALDRSESVSITDRTAQVESLVAALTDPRFVAAVRAGWQGRIGITVMTWSSFERTQVVVPWTLFAGEADAAGIIVTLRDYQASGGDVSHKPQTDIALALGAGAQLMDQAPFPTTKRILNIISDGIDNFGREAFVDRDLALEHGIIINGLVHARGHAIAIVTRFFETQVIGGPYSFVLATPTPETFTDAMLRKMLMEIADATRSSRPDGSGSLRPAPRAAVRG